MLEKRAKFVLTDPKLLNTPTRYSFFKDQGVKGDAAAFNETLLRLASNKEAEMETDSDATHFDLEAEIRSHPDSLFVKCFAIKADEMNDNGDYFGYDELKASTPTFVGVPVFTNHNNSDAEAARGKVVHSWWDDDRNGIMIIARVDAEAYPQLARGIKEEYIVGTSMGCFLGHNRVLMADGTYCPIDEVQSGDEVITHKGNVKPVINVQRHLDKENDEILHLSIRGIKDTIDVTKDHPFYVPKVQSKCSCGCESSVMDIPKSFEKYQKRYLKGHYQKTNVKIEDIRDEFDYHWMPANELKVGDIVCVPRLHAQKSNLSTEEARLIGLFLAEGSYLKRKGKRVAVEFNFSLDEQHTLGQMSIDLLRSVFPNENTPTTQIRADRNIFMVRLSGKSVATWFFDKCGEYSHGKRLASDILLENNDILSEIIGCFVAGDGHLRKVNGGQNYNIWTTSHYLRDQFDTILNKLGIKHSTTAIVNGKASTLRKAAGLGSISVDYENVDTRRPSYCIQVGQSHSALLSKYVPHKSMTRFVKSEKIGQKFVTNDFILTPITAISRSYNSDPVYTLQVAQDNSYIVEGVAVKNCQVKYSLCSVCHNKAETPDQYCEHIRERKTRPIEVSKQKCEYHKHGDEKECPICGSTKDEKKTFAVNTKAFEYNYGIKFIENSFVVNPACSDCGVTEVIDPQDFLAKVADIANRLPRLLKVAGETDVMCDDKKCMKVAGQQEIQQLQDALDNITSVSQSMLQQKDQLDLEFLSDLVKVLSDLQSVTDELTQQGYGRLQSPTQVPGQQTQPGAEGIETTHSVPSPPSPGKVQSGPAGQVGTITAPQAGKKQLNLEKASSQLLRKQKALRLQADIDAARKRLLDLGICTKSTSKKINLPFQL